MRARSHAILALVLVFLVGCISGAAGVYVWLDKARANSDGPGGHKAQRADLETRLHLSEQQKVQFAKIMDDSRGKFSACRKDTAVRFAGIRNEMRGQIRAILTEEQNREFETYLKQKDDEREKHRNRH